MTTEEQWRDIPGVPNYEVSNLGNFRRSTPAQGTYVGKPRKCYLNKATGYLCASFSEPTPSGHPAHRTYNVHRLVALAWVDGYQEGYHVKHLNGIRTDNRAENLQWTEPSEVCGVPCLVMNLTTGETTQFKSISALWDAVYERKFFNPVKFTRRGDNYVCPDSGHIFRIVRL